MASSSQQDSVNMGASGSETVVRVVTTSRNPEIWCNFDKCLMSSGVHKARCKACGKLLAGQSNSTLRNHTLRSCPALKGTLPQGQSTMSADGGVWNFNVEMVREEMAKFVIQESLPFDHFDNPRLTKLIQKTLQPRYHNVSRATLKRDCLKLWKIAKATMIEGFENLPTMVSLTSDIWSAPHGLPQSYICVTAHWIMPNTWQMMKRTIGFELFWKDHTGINMFEIIDNIIKTYKLNDKIFCISFDNASNNTTCCDALKLAYKPPCDGAFFHGRCFAHIINLAVQAGLKEVEEVINSFRVMLRDIFSVSKKRYTRFIQHCLAHEYVCLGPNWDVPTRWNSTCMMLEKALVQRQGLETFHFKLVRMQKASAPFPSENWTFIAQLADFLKVFKEATTQVSGVYYPTSCLTLNQLCLMSTKLKEYSFKGPVWSNIVKEMREKFVKYFQEMPAVISCAAALNPCLNFVGVEHLLSKISFDLELLDENPNIDTEMINAFNKHFTNLFDYYLVKHGNDSNIQQEAMARRAGASSSGTSSSKYVNLFNSLLNENTKRQRSNTPSSELARYKEADFLSSMNVEDFEHFDILAWWRSKENQFPILAIIAKDLLSVQASTVASESAFSTSGRVISIRRTRLSPASVEMCLCLKDYYDGIERVQDTMPLEGSLEVEERVYQEEVEEGQTLPLSDEERAVDQQLEAISSGDE